MTHTLMDLPFGKNELEPHMSAETLEYHHGKHHATYVKKLNDLIIGTEFEEASLTDIIKSAEGGIFNNGAQVYNHNFFWEGLAKDKKSLSLELKELLEKEFGSLEGFKESFLNKAATLFGSGWTWLCINEDDKLSIEQTCNANNPIRFGKIPLLTCDVWEHAYYIDYRNARPSYLDNWWEIINWEFVSNNLAQRREHLEYCKYHSDVCDYMDRLAEQETPAT